MNHDVHDVTDASKLSWKRLGLGYRYHTPCMLNECDRGGDSQEGRTDLSSCICKYSGYMHNGLIMFFTEECLEERKGLVGCWLLGLRRRWGRIVCAACETVVFLSSNPMRRRLFFGVYSDSDFFIRLELGVG